MTGRGNGGGALEPVREGEWAVVSAAPPPRDQAVHVWRVELDSAESRVRTLRELLSEDESLRADRFVFPHDRDRFIVARGALRVILGRYLGRRPEQLRFHYTAFGKPMLADLPQAFPLQFNVSHSRGVALVGVRCGGSIGVDVEYIRPDLAWEGLAEQVFTEVERAMLRAYPTEARRTAFFRAWTLKEAVIKAHGAGLSLPLDTFDVVLVAGQAPRLLRLAGDPAGPARWSLHELSVGVGYAGALAVEGPIREVKRWSWVP